MQVLNIFHVLIAIALVVFILIQKGQGATAGAAFGSGASGTVFGARGAGNFLSRTTWVLAVLFCTISLVMAVIVSRTSGVPENDLGVVGSGQSQAQDAPVIESDVGIGEGSEAEVFIGVDDSAESDIPVMDAVNDSPGDLPELDSGLIEDAAREEARAATDGEEPDTDGS